MQRILDEVSRLSPMERAELLDKIYESFDSEIDSEIKKARAEEAERRISEYRNGNIKSVSAEEVKIKERGNNI